MNENVQSAASAASDQIKAELDQHDTANPKKGSPVGAILTVIGPEVVDLLKGLAKNQLDALVAYIGTKFTTNYIPTQTDGGQ